MTAGPQTISMDDELRGTGLGLGANHQIPVYTESGPKTGAFFDAAQCEAIRAWDKGNDPRVVTDVIPAEALAPALENLLINHDGADLVRLMPKMLPALGLLFGPDMPPVPEKFMEEIKADRPHLLGAARNAPAYFSALFREGEGLRIAEGKRDLLYNGVSMELAALLLPVMFTALDEGKKIAAAQAMAAALHDSQREDKPFFAPLANPDYNRVKVTPIGGAPVRDIINNGRTLMIRAAHGPMITYQGRDYSSDNLHFHPLKQTDGSDIGGDAKPEFLTFRDPKHEQLCKKEAHLDPHRDVVGQLHAIFKAPDKRALLLGADVKIGAHNAGMGRYLDYLAAQKPEGELEVICNTRDRKEVAQKAITVAKTGEGRWALHYDPLSCFPPEAFTADGVPQTAFSSLHLGELGVHSPDDIRVNRSELFYRSVQVVHCKEPIEISAEQFATLRRLQPKPVEVDEKSCVHPVVHYQPPPERERVKGAGLQR